MTEQLIEFLRKTPKEYLLSLGIGSIGLILFAYGLMLILTHQESRENENQPQVFTTSITPKILKPVKIDVEGAVLHPGVYSLPMDSRIQDGLIAAGGISIEADRAWMEKNMNLSAKLIDGGKVYVMRKGESISASHTSVDTQPQISTLDINSATENELDSLPGIGPATASKIISGRPYQDPQELVSKKIISQSAFTKIQSQITTQ